MAIQDVSEEIGLSEGIRRMVRGVSGPLLERIEGIENERVKSGKPSLKQWAPFYGPFRAYDDAEHGRPSIMEREGHFFRCYGSLLWHFGSAVFLTFGIIWVYELMQDYVKELD